ncbi:MAG: tryptophan synthase subunit alpha [Acidimicrobiia bacterium]|nr:MAG: tryptophan synthase subunit alpha [Acidimicrobiia bacterium]
MADSGAQRLASMFSATATAGRSAFLPFMTAGLPDPASSLAMFEAMTAADGFELGIPYADPLMDGPVIASAGRRAIEAGVTMESALQLMERVVTVTGKPVIVMTYTNPVLQYGIDHFVETIAAGGGAGMIVVDLPVEEAAPFLEAARRRDIGMVLFVAPTTTDERLQQIADAQPVFLYGVARLGVTGEQAELGTTAAALAHRVRDVTDLPLVLGVGISTPEQVAEAGVIADGVIVGSALVRRVLEAADPQQAAAALGRAVEELAAALTGPDS